MTTPPFPIIHTAKGAHVRTSDVLASIAQELRLISTNSRPNVYEKVRRLAARVDDLAREVAKHE
jgi:hypothetical protein